jgi:hypothetical protein
MLGELLKSLKNSVDSRAFLSYRRISPFKVKAASLLSRAGVLSVIVLAACGGGDFGDSVLSDTSDAGSPSAGMTKGLVAYYRFDGDLEDASGVGLHGTAMGNITYASGVAGTSARFDGPDDFVSVPYSAALDTITQELTIAAWVMTSGSEPLNGHVVYRESTFDPLRPDDAIYALQVDGSATDPVRGLSFKMKGEKGPTSDLGATTFPSGTWTHVAVTFDGTIFKFYVDGSEALLGGFPFGFDAIETASSDLLIGKGASGLPLHAALDELRIYNYALSKTEIQELLQ